MMKLLLQRCLMLVSGSSSAVVMLIPCNSSKLTCLKSIVNSLDSFCREWYWKRRFVHSRHTDSHRAAVYRLDLDAQNKLKPSCTYAVNGYSREICQVDAEFYGLLIVLQHRMDFLDEANFIKISDREVCSTSVHVKCCKL